MPIARSAQPPVESEVARVLRAQPPPPSSPVAPLLGAATTQVLLATSQTFPWAQSAELAQVERHAPKAGSQMYGAQSKGTASSVLQVAPGAAQ
jgi:hypothetical protein